MFGACQGNADPIAVKGADSRGVGFIKLAQVRMRLTRAHTSTVYSYVKPHQSRAAHEGSDVTSAHELTRTRIMRLVVPSQRLIRLWYHDMLALKGIR